MAEPMGKFLALDFGTQRIGYALSDEGHTIAFPRATLTKTNNFQLFRELLKIKEQEHVEKIIIGLPLNEDYELTALAQKIMAFGKKLGIFLQLPIEYVDEFGSTDEAIAKIPFRKYRSKKGFRDALAAQIILQRYMDEKMVPGVGIEPTTLGL